MAEVLAAADLGDAMLAITALLVAGIGIHMVFKGGSLAKRGINRA